LLLGKHFLILKILPETLFIMLVTAYRMPPVIVKLRGTRL
jgi:hypothetical protein